MPILSNIFSVFQCQTVGRGPFVEHFQCWDSGQRSVYKGANREKFLVMGSNISAAKVVLTALNCACNSL